MNDTHSMNTVNYSRQTFQRWLVRALIPVAVTLLFWGCSGDPEATVVDFSRKVAVKQPGEQKSDSSILRVAVGAMISPRETATHYYALLGYIADKWEGTSNSSSGARTAKSTNSLPWNEKLPSSIRSKKTVADWARSWRERSIESRRSSTSRNCKRTFKPAHAKR